MVWTSLSDSKTSGTMEAEGAEKDSHTYENVNFAPEV